MDGAAIEIIVERDCVVTRDTEYWFDPKTVKVGTIGELISFLEKQDDFRGKRIACYSNKNRKIGSKEADSQTVAYIKLEDTSSPWIAESFEDTATSFALPPPPMIIPARTSIRPPGASSGTGTMKKNFAELLSDVNDIGTLSRSHSQTAATRLPPPPATAGTRPLATSTPLSTPVKPATPPTSKLTSSGSALGSSTGSGGTPTRTPLTGQLPPAKPASISSKPASSYQPSPQPPYLPSNAKMVLPPPPVATSAPVTYAEPEPEPEPEPPATTATGGTVLTAAIKVMKQKKLEEIAEREAIKASKPAPNSQLFVPQLRKVDSPVKVEQQAQPEPSTATASCFTMQRSKAAGTKKPAAEDMLDDLDMLADEIASEPAAAPATDEPDTSRFTLLLKQMAVGSGGDLEPATNPSKPKPAATKGSKPAAASVEKNPEKPPSTAAKSSAASSAVSPRKGSAPTPAPTPGSPQKNTMSKASSLTSPRKAKDASDEALDELDELIAPKGDKAFESDDDDEEDDPELQKLMAARRALLEEQKVIEEEERQLREEGALRRVTRRIPKSAVDALSGAAASGGASALAGGGGGAGKKAPRPKSTITGEPILSAEEDPCICYTCRKEVTMAEITAEKSLKACDRLWHKPCWKCFQCKKSLFGEQFGSDGPHVYCEIDFKRKFFCAACGEFVDDELEEGPDGRIYHPGECFRNGPSKNLPSPKASAPAASSVAGRAGGDDEEYRKWVAEFREITSRRSPNPSPSSTMQRQPGGGDTMKKGGSMIEPRATLQATSLLTPQTSAMPFGYAAMSGAQRPAANSSPATPQFSPPGTMGRPVANTTGAGNGGVSGFSGAMISAIGGYHPVASNNGYQGSPTNISPNGTLGGNSGYAPNSFVPSNYAPNQSSGMTTMSGPNGMMTMSGTMTMSGSGTMGGTSGVNTLQYQNAVNRMPATTYGPSGGTLPHNNQLQTSGSVVTARTATLPLRSATFTTSTSRMAPELNGPTGKPAFTRFRVDPTRSYHFTISAKVPGGAKESEFVYMIKIWDTRGGQPSHAVRAFKEIEMLYERLCKVYKNFKFPALPKPKKAKNAQEELEKLEKWLNSLARIEGIFRSEVMRQFMEGGPEEKHEKPSKGGGDISIGAPINVKHMQHYSPADIHGGPMH